MEMILSTKNALNSTIDTKNFQNIDLEEIEGILKNEPHFFSCVITNTKKVSKNEAILTARCIYEEKNILPRNHDRLKIQLKNIINALERLKD